MLAEEFIVHRKVIASSIYIFWWPKIEIRRDRNSSDVIGLHCIRPSEETEKCVVSFISCSFGDSDWMKVVAFDPQCVNIVKIFISVRQITSATCSG